MKKIIVFIFVTALVFLLFSCGIPSIYVPSSSDIVITTPKDTTTGEFTVSLSSTVLSEMADGFPYIYFYYTVSSASQSQYSSAISSFNTTYCTDTAGTMVPTTHNDTECIASYTTGSGDSKKTYGIYQLYRLTSCNISGKNSITLTLKPNTDTGTLTLLDEDGNEVEKDIRRYNGYYFTKSDFVDSNKDHSEIVDFVNGPYTVKVYALVSCQFNAYSNIYNTKLSYNYPILEFTLTL